MITNISDLADRLKGITLNGEEITPEKLIDAIKSEDDFSFESIEGKFLTADSLEELKTTVKQNGYEEGKTAGSEMTIKDIKKAKGLEFEGKTIPTLLKYYDEKLLKEANIEPNEKISGLNESLQTLQSKYENDLSEWSNKLSEKETELKTVHANSFMSINIPDVEGYKKSHLIAAFKADGYGITHDEQGSPVPTLHGKIIKTDMEKVKPFKEVANDWISVNGFDQSRGRGGRNEPGRNSGEYKTISDVMKHLHVNKIDPTSVQGLEIINRFEESQK